MMVATGHHQHTYITRNVNFHSYMDTCTATKAVSLDVKSFMENVPDVKEESITDYLVWRWRELDKRFKYINITLFTRQQEATTGADFELELWLVGRKFHLPLILQAKKFIKEHDSYVAKLNYPKGTQAQLQKLLAYAKVKKKLPFYAFYSIPDAGTQTMCKYDESDTAVFMADANRVKEFADGIHGTKVSKNQLLKISNPFHCMFCCPLIQLDKYFKYYFFSQFSETKPHDNKQLPEYVSMLLDGRISENETLDVIKRNELRVFRVVGTYDMRDDERA